MSPPDHRLHSVLEHAGALLRAGHAAALEQALVLLTAQCASAPRALDRENARVARDALASAQGAMNAAFHRRLQATWVQAGPVVASTRSGDLDWEALTLVDEAQVESDLALSRTAQQVGHVAEWEFRDLAALLQSLAGPQRVDVERLPLRPAAIAEAFQAAVRDTVTEPELRSAVLQALTPQLLQQLPSLLRRIVSDIKSRGVRPIGLAIGSDAGPSTRSGNPSTQRDGLRSTPSSFDARSSRQAPLSTDLHEISRHTTSGRANLDASGRRSYGPPAAPGTTGFGGSLQSQAAGASTFGAEPPQAYGKGRSPASDDTLRALLRRLSTLSEVAPPASSGNPSTAYGHEDGEASPARATRSARLDPHDPHDPKGVGGFELPPLAAPNLIRLHQAELERAATGTLDHLVIEVVGALFDQILSDNRVPPQMARQIARLQLPVLRVTLIDPSFFASRRHPVRQFINRVASLACAYDQFESGPGQVLLERVTRLVQDIVDGDFEQIEVYIRTLRELEQHTADAAEAAVEHQAAAPTLVARKESQLRTQQRYRAQLQAALEPIKLPTYLHDFLTQVWSQALLEAARASDDPAILARYRAVGRDLVLSIQPKGSTAQRQRFLLQLPGLMRDLAEGVARIGWPTPAHQTFLNALQPSHASALRSAPLSELDYNLLSRRLDSVFGAPLPGADATAAMNMAPADATSEDSVPVAFSEDEARQIGFIPDQTVPLNGPLLSVQALAVPTFEDDPRTTSKASSVASTDLDLDLSATAAAAPAPSDDTGPVTLPQALEEARVDPVAPLAREAGLDIDLGSATLEAVEPARGGGLADHLRIGFAYEMLLQDRWQKVRLSHVSPARSFFVFTHGHRHQQTLTMTARMVRRICEGGRMRAVESAYLIERASERAREQLAKLGRKGSGAAAALRTLSTTT